MLRIFDDAGFQIVLTEPKRWNSMPVSRRKLHSEYRDLPDEELLTHGFLVVLRRSADVAEPNRSAAVH
jgi:hypothetical protein